MNEFEKAVESYIGEENLRKIQGVKVGIAGAGGLGSNCACNLVRSGFKKLKIVDFDLVEFSNLNRQFYFTDQIGIPKVEALKANLLRINPDLELDILQYKINEDNAGGIFKGCDVVVEAFDEVFSKKILIESYIHSGRLLVAASGIAGWGESDNIVVKRIHNKFYLVGDGVSEVCRENPPVSPRVNIAAAKQADIVLEYVLRNF